MSAGDGGNIQCHGQVRLDGKPFVRTMVSGEGTYVLKEES